MSGCTSPRTDRQQKSLPSQEIKEAIRSLAKQFVLQNGDVATVYVLVSGQSLDSAALQCSGSFVNMNI